MADQAAQLAVTSGTSTLGSVNTSGYWDNGHFYTWPYTGTYPYIVSAYGCRHCWCSKTVQGSEQREHPKCCKCSEVGSIVPTFVTAVWGG